MATKNNSDKKKDDPCWKGYKQPGTKIKEGKNFLIVFLKERNYAILKSLLSVK